MITMAKIRNIRNILATVLILGSMSFSISNAQSLELVGSCDLIGDPEFIAVGGGFAYIGGYNPLLQIVNILDPENPFVVGSIDPGYRTWDLCISKNHVFIAGNVLLFIIDVSDPSSPSLISTFEPYFVAHDVTVINNIAYLLDCYRLYVIDISNLAEPELLSDIILYINHADRMAIRDNYAYIESYAGSSPSGLRIVSIEDPSNPVLLGGSTDISFGQDIALVQDFAYIPKYHGIKIVNISDPSNPYLAGQYDAADYTREIYVDGNFAFLAELHNFADGGIRILNISQPLQPQPMIYYNDHPYYDVFYCDGLLYSTRLTNKLDIFRFSAPTNIEEEINTPNYLQYLGSFPNPFNSSTAISFTLTRPGMIKLSIYNIQGQLISELLREIHEAGDHSISWDAAEYPSGVYFARLEAGGSSKTAKMVLLK
jgi:hypothetical protein